MGKLHSTGNQAIFELSTDIKTFCIVAITLKGVGVEREASLLLCYIDGEMVYWEGKSLKILCVVVQM